MKQESVNDICFVIGVLESCYKALDNPTITKSIEKLWKVLREEED